MTVATKPLASVIVPARNAEATLARCLSALDAQSLARPEFEVIVVDDASTDGTARVAEAAGARILRLPRRTGPAAARNRGAREAGGTVLVFTDADCEPDRWFLERILEPLRADAGITGAKGVYAGYPRALVARFVQYEYEERYRRTARRFAARGAIDFVDTYAAAFRRVDFLEAGGFDESFPTASVEDHELSFRLAGRGKRLVFVPEARVVHHGHAASLGAYARKKFRIGYWKAAVLRRHPGKTLDDSHTPPGLKLQLLLAPLPPLFFLTTIPFVLRLVRADPVVALLAPGLLYVRAWSLGLGLVAGLVSGVRLSAAEAGQVPRPPLPTVRP